MIRKTTAKEVAEEAGVSRSLVSMYLSKNPKTWLSPETKQRIDAAVKKLNYKPREAGRILRGGKTRNAGLILGGLVNSGGGMLAEAMLEAFDRKGYRLILGITKFDPERERRVLDAMLEQELDALIYTLWPKYAADILNRLPMEYPIFLTTAEPEIKNAGWVTWDLNPALEKLPYRKIAIYSDGLTRYDRESPPGNIRYFHERTELQKYQPDCAVLLGNAVSPEKPEFPVLKCGFETNPEPALKLPLDSFAEKMADAVIHKINEEKSTSARIEIPAELTGKDWL